MASRYWVGGTATWDATAGTKWATTSGGVGGASVPGAADDVFFDALSLGTSVVTLTTGGVSQGKSITCTGFTGTWVLPNTSSALDVYGSLILASGMTLTIGGANTQINMKATTTGWVLTTAGKVMPGIAFNGAGGGWTQTDALAATGGNAKITLTAGTWATGNFAVTTATFSSSNSNARTLAPGSSAISLTGTGTIWDVTTSTNMAVSPNTSIVTVSGTTATFTPGSINYNGMSLVFSGPGTAAIASGVFFNLTRTGTASRTDGLVLNGSMLIVTGTLTLTGNSIVNRLLIQSSALGTARTIAAAKTAITNTDFMDVNANGSMLTANQSTVETDTTGFTAGSNTGMARSTAQAFAGAASLALTASNTADTSALLWDNVTKNPVTPNVTYNFVAMARANTTGRACLAIINWYTAAGAYISQSTSASTADVSTAWTSKVVTAAAPANAAFAIASVYVGGGPLVAGEVHYFDEMYLLGPEAAWNLSAVGGGSGDAGGNSNITFTTAITNYKRSSGTSWGATGSWSSTSTAGASNGLIPLPQDAVVFDAVSANTTIDQPRVGKDITFTGYTGTLTLTITSFSLYGSLTLAAGMVRSGTGTPLFSGRGSHTITMAGVGFPGVQFVAPGGTYTLQDAFTLTGALTQVAGTLNTNAKAVTVPTYVASGSLSRTLTGGSVISLTSTAATTVWSMSPTNFTLVPTGMEIVISTASANSRSFSGGGLTYGTLTYTVAGSTGSLVLFTANTFAALNFSDATNARTLTLPASTVTTITSPNIVGTAGKLMTINSSTAATAATLTKAGGGTVGLDYLSLQDIAATPASTWYAGTHSTNVSGNSGWTFTVAPPTAFAAFGVPL